MPNKNIACTVSYRGGAYHGWQKQPGKVTVQGIIEQAVYEAFGKKVNAAGAGRTDAGVHAFGQVFNFFIDSDLKADVFKRVLNNILPRDIRITSSFEAPENFNARRRVIRKFYRYIICCAGEKRAPFYDGLCWHIKRHIDADKIKELIPFFSGVKDYFSFSSSGSEPKTYEREITAMKVKTEGHFIIIDFFGKSFLYNMIRRITAFFVKYASGKIGIEKAAAMFKKRDRTIFGEIAPACGLYLVKVSYRQGVLRRCRGVNDE